MTKQVKIIHIIITAVAWGIFIFSLIWLSIVYNSLAEKIGIHFDSDGNFDVIDSKKYITYPYLVSLISLVLCEIFSGFSKKIKSGMKISEKGENKIRQALIILLDIFKCGLSFFFAGVWADCVIRQQPLNTSIPNIIFIILFISFILFIIFSVAVKVRNPDETAVNIEN